MCPMQWWLEREGGGGGQACHTEAVATTPEGSGNLWSSLVAMSAQTTLRNMCCRHQQCFRAPDPLCFVLRLYLVAYFPYFFSFPDTVT